MDKTTYTSDRHPDLTVFVRSRLPPNLKMLSLYRSTCPDGSYPSIVPEIFPKDLALIRCILEHKENLAPRLKYFYMYYRRNVVMPKELHQLAVNQGVTMKVLGVLDDIKPDLKWLDEDQ